MPNVGPPLSAMIRKRPIDTRLRLGTFAALVLLTLAGRTVAQDSQELSIAGLSGITTVAPGGEVAIYTVQLNSAPANFVDSDLGCSGGTCLGGPGLPKPGIELIVDDLSAATGLTAGDFSELRLYRSDNNSFFDPGDTQIASNATVVIGGETLLDVTGAAAILRRLPDAGAFTYFIATAVISSSAVPGHAFTLATVGPHYGIDESNFGGPVDAERGTLIGANDGNHVVISVTGSGEAKALSGSRGMSIPFGGEPAMLCLLLGSGVLVLWRRASV